MPRARKQPPEPAARATRATTTPPDEGEPSEAPSKDKPSILPGTPKHLQLTDAYIRALPAPTKRDSEFYGLGFGVRLTPNGSKTFVYAYTADKKRSMTLGPYPTISLAEARERHARALRLVERGIDPVEEAAKEAAVKAEETEKAKREAEKVETFRDVFARWKRIALTLSEDEDGERQGRKDGGAAIEAQFDLHVFPKFGDTPIREVSRKALLELIDDTKAAGKRRTAMHLFANLRQMLDFAVEREHIAGNPLAALKTRKIVGKAKIGDRVLADWEVARLLQRLPLVDMHIVTQLALRFVLATGQRPGEVAAMAKAELEEDGTLWRIPASKYKTNTEHTVPLSQYARRILEEAAAYNAGSAYVFPSPQNKPAELGKPRRARNDRPPKKPAVDRPLDRHSLSKAISRKLGTAVPKEGTPKDGELGLARFTPHDQRRTCRTGLAALGVDERIAERVLGHLLQGIEKVYNKHHYLEEKRAALELWGNKLDALAVPQLAAGHCASQFALP